MSEEIINNVKLILKGILNPDNKARNESVAQLDELRKNPSLLLVCLVRVISGKLNIIL